jgi:hypothetical protein
MQRQGASVDPRHAHLVQMAEMLAQEWEASHVASCQLMAQAQQLCDEAYRLRRIASAGRVERLLARLFREQRGLRRLLHSADT